MTASQGCRFPAPSHYIKSAFSRKKGKGRKHELAVFLFSNKRSVIFPRGLPNTFTYSSLARIGSHGYLRLWRDEYFFNWACCAMPCCAKLLMLWLTLCNPVDCSPPGSSVYRFFQARTLEWVALLRGIFLTQGSNPCFLMPPALASGFFTTRATWEALNWTYCPPRN